MSYAIYLNRVRMPVNPEELQVKDTRSVKEYDILNVGNVGLVENKALTTYEWASEFPAHNYSYCVSWQQPSTFINLVKDSMKSNSPIELTISNGTSLGISTQVIITSFTTKEIEAGGYNYSITCKEYVEPMIIAQSIISGYVRPAPIVEKKTSSGSPVIETVNKKTESIFDTQIALKRKGITNTTVVPLDDMNEKVAIVDESKVRDTTWGSLNEYQQQHAELTAKTWAQLSDIFDKTMNKK